MSRKAIVNKSTMVEAQDFLDDDPEEQSIVRQRGREAADYLNDFRWTKSIDKLYFAGGFSKIAVFYAELQSDNYDDQLWVIVGDVPPAHLVVDEIPDFKEALLSYAFHMHKWVRLVRSGKSTKSCIPVNALPTIENADLLEDRLNFIENEYVPNLN